MGMQYQRRAADARERALHKRPVCLAMCTQAAGAMKPAVEPCSHADAPGSLALSQVSNIKCVKVVGRRGVPSMLCIELIAGVGARDGQDAVSAAGMLRDPGCQVIHLAVDGSPDAGGQRVASGNVGEGIRGGSWSGGGGGGLQQVSHGLRRGCDRRLLQGAVRTSLRARGNRTRTSAGTGGHTLGCRPAETRGSVPGSCSPGCWPGTGRKLTTC